MAAGCAPEPRAFRGHLTLGRVRERGVPPSLAELDVPAGGLRSDGVGAVRERAAPLRIPLHPARASAARRRRRRSPEFASPLKPEDLGGNGHGSQQQDPRQRKPPGGHYHYGWGSPYYPYWGGWWGWAPYYSSWWWGGPSYYVVAGNGYGDAVDTVSYADEWSDLGAAPSSYEGVSEENMDVRSEPLPRPAGYRARMRFTITPADAAVYVDDKYLGPGEDLSANARGVVTVPGAHAITVARPGYKTKTVRVNARIVTPVDVVVELEK